MTQNKALNTAKIIQLDLRLTRENNDVPKSLKAVKKTKPLQGTLFQFLAETDVFTEDGSQMQTGRTYSQTFELIDFMPRYKFGQQAELRKNYNGLLPALVRDFQCRTIPYQLTLTPAIVVENGESIAYYPSANEDLMETVLRKMYLDGAAQFYDGSPGLSFTINQIRKEMKEQGHSRSHKEVVKSLRILWNAGINCVNKETDLDLSFNVLDTLVLSKKNEADSPCYLIFSKIYGEAIEGLYFRRVNYKQVVGYKSDFARLLHRRISHHFTQAREDLEYTIYLTSLLNDFGLEFPTLAKGFAELKKAVALLKKSNVIKDFDFEPVLSSKGYGKYEDYFIKIKPTKTFSFEMSGSNKVKNNVLQIASRAALPPSPEETEKPVKASGKTRKPRKLAEVLPSSLNKKSRENK